LGKLRNLRTHNISLQKHALRGLQLLIVIAAFLAALQVAGCYYIQAAGGQMEISRKRTPINEVIENPDTPEQLRSRLKMVQSARLFAIDELLLPDNESYQTFVDLERDYVVWNVMAAPEFSLQAKTWCYPIVGCVAYRGYFAEKKARDLGGRLRDDGYDVFVGGVTAYSTLGRFADPVLNTMMRWSDADLVATLFHELAHQKLFIKGDTGFNESFATAVAEIGIERWLAAHGTESEISEYMGRVQLRETLMALVEGAKIELEALYNEVLDDEVKRGRKKGVLEGLSADAGRAVEQQPFPADNWLRAPLNNARLASLVLYRGQLDDFHRLLERCENDLSCFYQRVESIAKLPQEEGSEQPNESAVAKH
jgi:predicted aminopeptidase